MAPLAHAVLRDQITQGTLGPLYLLTGDDESEKVLVAQEFAESVDEGLRAFNVDRLYGGETSVDRLIAVAATFPMMAPRRIVLVLAAESLLVPRRESKASEEAQERLEAFIEDPPAHATVVFVCGSLDRRRRLVKRLEERAQVVDCGTLEHTESAVRWVAARAAQAGVPLDDGAVRALVDRGGRDIRRLRAGIERVGLYAWGEPRIGADAVYESVSAGPEESERQFALADAIGTGNVVQALRELRVALDAGAGPFMVLGQVRLAAERQPPARLGAALEAVLRTDLALKSSGDAEVLLQRLVVELCGQGPGAPRTMPSRPMSRR